VIPGKRVFHPTFGNGVITAVDEVGARARWRAHVDFEYTKVWVVFAALQLLPAEVPAAVKQEESPVLGAPQVGGATTDSRGMSVPTRVEGEVRDVIVLGGSEADARMGISALRLGQVLDSQALQLSVGTERIQTRLKEALARAQSERPTCLLVDGAWGRGKTHALTLLVALARRENMAVASAVMDGIAVSLSEPMLLMEEIASSLRVPGSAVGDSLGQLLRRAKRDGKISTLRAQGALTVADALDGLPAAAFDDPEGLQCIEDYFSFALLPTQVKAKLRLLGYEMLSAAPSLRARAVDDRPRAFSVMLRNWAQFLSVMGARGLLVVLDELDVEYAASAGFDRPSLKLRARRRALLEQLRTLSQHRAPLLVAFASAPAGPDVQTENDAVQDVREAIGPDLIYLRAADPSAEDLKELLSRLAVLYDAAYPATRLGLPPQRVNELATGILVRYRRMPDSVPRHFVRMAIEAFDLLAVGGQSFEDVLRLLGASGE